MRADGVITIDGPAGAGKTTISRMLADRLGYRYVDTGALYRGIAVMVIQEGIAFDDDAALDDLCTRINISFGYKDGSVTLAVNGEDITDRIRAPEVTMAASAVSARPVVRDFLLDIQRDLGDQGQVVFEGRDMGTVVFPAANVKFFLDADLEERALRRFREMPAESDQDLAAVRSAMAERDHNDSHRDVAPLQAAADAVRIDSTRMTIDAVVECMIDHIRNRFDPTIP